MRTPAWWLLPLLLAVVIDALLIARYEVSPGTQVSRAITRTIRGGACEEDILVRGPAMDNLFVVDSWMQNNHLVSVPSTVAFAPGAGITPQSLQTIQQGGEVDLSTLRPALPTPRRDLGIRPLLHAYDSQLGAGQSWLQGPCVPFANPFQSHLRLAGSVTDFGTTYTVFQGRADYARGGASLVGRARVWFGVQQDGRLGFELLEQEPTRNANPAVNAIATLFSYPSAHLGASFARQPAVQRETFYVTTYDRVLALIALLQARGTGA